MRWIWTKRIYMWYLHIRRHFNDAIFLFWCENTMGDMLILIIILLRIIKGNPANLLKEYFHALDMDKTHIYVVFTY